MQLNRLFLSALLIVAVFKTHAASLDSHSIQLSNEIQFKYLGAFRFSTETYGKSRMSYANGPFTIAPNGKDFFIVGHAQHQGIAQFSMPRLSTSKRAKELPFAIEKQPFSTFLKNSKRLKNKQKLDRITGMEVIDGELFINAVEYYDAPGDNSDTTFIIRDPSNLKSSKVSKMLKLGDRAKGAGWISKIPQPLTKDLGGRYLLGYANNYAINSRFSVGPSAYSSNLDNFAGIQHNDRKIPVFKMMSFSTKRPIHKDQYNDSRKNNIWTEVSYAAYGFIHPDKKHYVVIGNSGGHKSGIGYKITQNNGNTCGGPCAYDAKDYYNYFWLFKVEDLIKARQKNIRPHMLKPVKVGELDVPFQSKKKVRKIIGADFDFNNNRLWMLIESVDYSQSEFESAPVMVVYEISDSAED